MTTFTDATLSPASFDDKTISINAAIKTHIAEVEMATNELHEALAIPSSVIAQRKALDRYNREIQRAAAELKGKIERIEHA